MKNLLLSVLQGVMIIVGVGLISVNFVFWLNIIGGFLTIVGLDWRYRRSTHIKWDNPPSKFQPNNEGKSLLKYNGGNRG